MQLRILHILCDHSDAVKQAKEIVKGWKSIIKRWERHNDDSTSLYFLINDQDQEIYDALQNLAEKQDSIRLIIQHVGATVPQNFKDQKKEKEENQPTFFDIISREEMLEVVKQQARMNGTYISLVVISSIVATLALIDANLVVLIGSMVLTPLLGPNLALALSTTTADSDLTKQASLSGAVGFILTLLAALGTGFIVNQPANKEIIPMLVGYGFESIPIAVCAGLAATILLLQGTISSLIGVMVAVAFLPPLAMTGLSLSAGDYINSANAFILFLINLSSFNLAAKAMLLIAGIKPRRSEDGVYTRRNIIIYVVGWTAAICLLSVSLFFRQ